MAAAIKYDVFLNYDWQDQDQANALAARLRAQNLRVFDDCCGRHSGVSWSLELERILASCSSAAICIGRGDMEGWQLRVVQLILKRALSEPDYPVIPVLLPGSEPALGFYGSKIWIDLRQRLDQAQPMTMLAAVIRRRPLGHAFQERIKETVSGLNPYRGLSYFREEDARFFFGRADAVKKLNTLLQRCPLIAVAGPSGSGKSSLVRAGLLPELRKELQNPWEILTIVPGNSPLVGLTRAFMPLLYPGFDEEKRAIKMAEHLAALARQPSQLKHWITTIRKLQPGFSRILLVVDQWDELYSLRQERMGDVCQTTTFINALLIATDADMLSAVFTVRADFMGHVIGYRPLADRVQDSLLSLGPMNIDEMRLAIEKPAEQLGGGFENGLVDKILTDAAGSRDGLSLLECTLRRLWDEAESHGKVIGHPVYAGLNGLDGALNRTADEAFETLSEQGKIIAQRVLLTLVQTGDGIFDIGRRETISGLGAEALPIINHLLDHGLLTLKRGPDEAQDTVELAHEALVRHWRQFKGWLVDGRQFDIWRARLDLAQKTGEMLKNHSLVEARHWRRLRSSELSRSELDYIDQCRKHDRYQKSRRAAAIFAPLGVVLAFAVWVGTEDLLTPKLGIYVLLAKAGVTYFIEPDWIDVPPEEPFENGNALTFAMGPGANEQDADKIEFPRHRVTLKKPFRMSKYEITFDQYQVFAYLIEREGGCADRHKVEASRVQDEKWGRGKRPVINVSWKDAVCYAQWLTKTAGVNTPYRLPTEAEWEFAARAGTDTSFWWGDSLKKQMAVCDGCLSEWNGKNDKKQTAEVDDPAFTPNGWGLYHTSGNVWEWVQDCWHENYDSAPADGSAWESENNGDCGKRVLRGGSWVDTPVGLRLAYRYKLNTDYRYYNIGFRLAQSKE
ncbi:MAG: nSTAND1 domain-containing NTPase [Gammaproteobacteria bacterium]